MVEFFKKRKSEKQIGKASYRAACGEENPIELYFLKEGYPYGCRDCGQTTNYKMLFLSPKHEVEGDFGPTYFCQSHVPDVHEVAANEELYFQILYGGRKK